MADEPVDYEVIITRRVTNPDWKEPVNQGEIMRRLYGNEGGPERYLSQTVTTVTLNADQWRDVQAAIVEALK